MIPTDYPAVAAIYREGIVTGNATFNAEAPSWEAWDKGHLPVCRLLAAEGASVLGWVALSAVSERPVYRGVAELQVYIAAAARGRGLGRLLLDALIEESERQGIWTLQAGIFPENSASIALHGRAGFRLVGRREHLGRMPNGEWRDVLILERRSTVVGRGGTV